MFFSQAAPPPTAPAAPAVSALSVDTSNYETWTKEQTFDWLVSKSGVFEKYRAKFYENDVNGELLKCAVCDDDETLQGEDFGVTKLHHAQMKKYVQALVDGKDVPIGVPSTPGSAKKGKPKQVAPPKIEENETELADRLARIDMQEKEKTVIWEQLLADPNQQLIAAKTWEQLDLKEGLLTALYQEMKFQKPAKIQEQALPLGLKDPPENGIYQAKSGHGKTCAFCLIMLMRIDEALDAPQALCLAPVYELAVQSAQICAKMGSGIGATVQLAVADSSCYFAKGEKCNKHIIIGTPGKINSLLKMKVIDASQIKVFVLDEADMMVQDGGHKEATLKIKKFMPNAQTLLFSASFEEDTYKFAKKLCKKKIGGKEAPFNEIKIKETKDVMLEEISQFYIKTNAAGSEDANKQDAMSAIFGSLTVGQSIIFVEQKRTADTLSRFMQDKGHNVAALHGGIDKEIRLQLYQEFKENKRRVLIATNALARGIDVPGMSLVVNYDFPVQFDKDAQRGAPKNADYAMYQHRIGRCGRFGKKGCAFTFVHTADDERMLNETKEHFQCKIEEASGDDAEELEQLVKDAQKSSKK